MTITISYNEQNLPKKLEYDLDGDTGTADYSYNENGKLILEIWSYDEDRRDISEYSYDENHQKEFEHI